MKPQKISVEELLLAQHLGAAIRPFFKFSTIIPARHIQLFLLVACDQGRSCDHYAKRVGISRTTASRFLLDMEARKRDGSKGYGLLWGERNPVDAREKLTWLTPKGRQLLAEIAAPFQPITIRRAA